MNAGSFDVRRINDTVMHSIRDNPIAAALLGMGVVWLVSSKTSAPQAMGRVLQSAGDALSSGKETVVTAARQAGSSLREFEERAEPAIGDTIDSASRYVRSASGRLRETAHDVADRAVDATSDLRDRVADYGKDVVHDIGKLRRSDSRVAARLNNARDWLSEALDKEPLLLAAGALAVGAAIAATLPVASAAENLGEKARKLADDASDLTTAGIARAVDSADDVARAAMKQAERHGLTPGQLAQTAGETFEKARTAATDAAHTAADKLL